MNYCTMLKLQASQATTNRYKAPPTFIKPRPSISFLPVFFSFALLQSERARVRNTQMKTLALTSGFYVNTVHMRGRKLHTKTENSVYLYNVPLCSTAAASFAQLRTGIIYNPYYKVNSWRDRAEKPEPSPPSLFLADRKLPLPQINSIFLHSSKGRSTQLLSPVLQESYQAVGSLRPRSAAQSPIPPCSRSTHAHISAMLLTGRRTC